MKSIIFYNLYPKNHWKELTLFLLSNVPHDDIVINVALDRWDRLFKKKSITKFLQPIPKVKAIYFTENSKMGEVPGFENMRKQIDLSGYNILTYLHSKGVTKPNNPNISDWVKLMHYFLIERFDLCKEAFANGCILYGVNLSEEQLSNSYNYGPSKFSNFHYSGNFVSMNLSMVRDKFIKTPIDPDYFGLEGFFGKLCDYRYAYNAHLSSNNIRNHYIEHYPEKFYRS